MQREEHNEASGLHGVFVCTTLISPTFFFCFLFYFFFLKGVFLACMEEQRTGSLDAGQSGADGVQASHAVLPVKTPLS